jgi:hypothetical protein
MLLLSVSVREDSNVPPTNIRTCTLACTSLIEPSNFQDDIHTVKFKKYKSSGTDKFQGQLGQTGGETLRNSQT